MKKGDTVIISATPPNTFMGIPIIYDGEELPKPNSGIIMKVKQGRGKNKGIKTITISPQNNSN